MGIRGVFAPLAIAAVMVWSAYATACGEQRDAEQKSSVAETIRREAEVGKQEVEKGAKVAEENVERSVHVAEETYKTERKEGVGRIDAAGDAYEEVREIPLKKKKAEKKQAAE